MAYTAPRRLRMATADEDVDTRAIANQAANELREQIEASPIPDRLEQVVAEDRPLAARIASADTALVEEPDDSPSAREISFQLREPTWRGAIRSALRTPGLAADLHPVSPLTDEDTGIEPEAVITAKPEAADAEIVEPKQPGEQDRSPAGPDRDATAQNAATDELADLHKAQRRDRRMAIAGGVLRGVSALAGLIGRATGAPVLAGLGGMSGVASQLIPQGRAVEAFGQEHALRKGVEQDRQRAEQTAYERGQDAMRNARAEEQLRGFMENAESGRANAAARTALEQRAAEAEAGEAYEKTNPASTRARNQRNRFASLLDATVAARPDLQGVGERYEGIDLSTMNAEEIGTLIEDVQNVSRLPQGARIGRRGGGTGPSRPAAPQNTPQLETAYNTLIATRSRQTGIPEDTLRAAYPDMAFALNPDEPRSLINASSSAATQDVNREQQLATQDETMIVPGWARQPGAPRLQPGAAQDARERVATFNALSTYAQQMTALANRVDSMQRAGAAAGILGREVARARHIHEQMISALRTIGNYGVPNGTELQRMESLAPRLDSVDGLLNARNLYDGMRRTIWTSTLAKMRADGYVPERRSR